MALPITIPNTFATETTNIPLSDLDANFTTVADAVNGIGDGSEPLANVAVTGGTINGAVIGGSNAVAGTFTTLTANATTVTTLTVLSGGGIAPTGSLTMWAGAVASPPTGWLACNGANVSRTTYSALFGIVGTTWGAGDGSTTFTLPNLLNKFPVGAGDTYALAATGGSANAIVVSHTHTATSVVSDTALEPQLLSGNVAISSNLGQLDGSYGITGTDLSQGSYVRDNISGNPFVKDVAASISVATTNSTEGSSATNANLPPYIAVGFIIKT
jgi:microcystin-dependent protein